MESDDIDIRLKKALEDYIDEEAEKKIIEDLKSEE